MILNVSHITLACRQLLPSIEFVREAGFDPQFLHERLANADGKKRFMGAPRPDHALAFCKNRSPLAIELVDHFNPLSSNGSPYRALFSRSLPRSAPARSSGADLETSSAIWRDVFGRPVAASFWEPFATPYWHWTERAGRETSVPSLQLEVPKLSVAERFWREGVGCSVAGQGTTSGRNWIKLQLATPLSAGGLLLVLCEKERKERAPFIDDSGFACLALLTFGLQQTADRLAKAGAVERGDPFLLEVGGRALKGQLLRGPSDELLELIEVRPGND